MSTSSSAVSGTSSSFIHQRHKSPTRLERPRELVVATVPMRSNVNLSQIARTASACGVDRLIVCGNAKLIKKIARDGSPNFDVEVRRTLGPVLTRMEAEGYRIVVLEQASGSVSLPTFTFPRKCVLVVGNERLGVSQDILDLAHDVVEIPIWGHPHSHNAATATTMALYESCRQFPMG